MCTITLEYNQNSALARRKLAALLATGLFLQKDVKPDERLRERQRVGASAGMGDQRSGMTTPEEVEAHHKFIEEFLYASKINSAKAFARHLK